MRILFFLLFITLGQLTHADYLRLVRKAFHNAVLDREKIRAFHDYVFSLPQDDAKVQAYQAAAEALSAQLEWSPLRKYQLVLNFSRIIDSAIERDPLDPEIRFLRQCVEFNIPRFLGLSNNLQKDKEIIMERLTEVQCLSYDPYFTKFIVYFIRETGLYTTADVGIISTRLGIN